MNKLTEEQKKIVYSEDKNILCVANAGTGKTYTLVHRVENLIKTGVKPNNILLTSFSRSANAELQNRIMEKVGEKGENIHISTIHSFCYKIILENKSLTGYKSLEVVNDAYYTGVVLNQSAKEGRVMKRKDARALASKFQKAKLDNTLNDLKETDRILCVTVDGLMQAAGKITFSDILIIANNLLDLKEVQDKYNYFEHIMLDELQDTSYIQFQIVEKIVNDKTNLFLVGDAKQQIYGFRGCSYKFMDSFAKKVDAKVFYLTETFRFGQKVADLANIATEALEGLEDIYKNPTVTEVKTDNNIDFKYMYLDDTAVDIATEIKKLNASGTPYKEIFVLYRFNKDSLPIQKELSAALIPYVTKSGSFLNRAEIKFLINACSLLKRFNLTTMLDLLRKYNNKIDSIILNRAYQQASDKEDTLSVLESGYTNFIEGVGTKRKSAFEDLYFKFVSAKSLLRKNSPEFFIQLANILDIDEADFMSNNVDSTSGENNYQERWNFIIDFQGFFDAYTKNEKFDVYAFFEKIKVDFSDSNEDSKDKNVVTLMTIHGSKGMTLPYVYLVGHNIANPAFFKNDTPLDELLSEKFLLYVALTRVSKDLVFYHDSPKTFLFNYILPKDSIEEPDKKIFTERDLNKFRSNMDTGDYLPLRGFSLLGISSTGKSVGFSKKAKRVWVSQRFLGYDCGMYYIPKWMAQKNDIVHLIA
jgi:DNA helicase-2/ATP-dependent DNA helicase PcrA